MVSLSAHRPRIPAIGTRVGVPRSEANPVVLRSGETTIIAAEPVEIVRANGVEALTKFDCLTPGWWAGFFSYDLGRSIERVARRDSGVTNFSDQRVSYSVPDLLLARFDARWISNGTRSYFEGSAKAVARLEKLISSAPTEPEISPLTESSSSLTSEAFTAGVRTILDLIADGQCYQVNLSRQIKWEKSVDARALHRALSIANPAPHASLIILPGENNEPITVVSASPESFLTWSSDDQGTVVKTRPIKGTGRDAHSLGASAKDRAENIMIVDLARNDLGRVCRFGSIRVPDLCSVEEHPGLWHLVSTVQGVSRTEIRPGDLLRATFPPASITGAPKPRVMQIIEDLEPVNRGVYCGAIGWVDTTRNAGDLAVAIRTFVSSCDQTTLGVGGGIVADSDPESEWRETELKAARLLGAAGARDVGIAV